MRLDPTTGGHARIPSALKPLLKFSKLPARAVGSVLEVLDTDDEFRAFVADGLEEDQPDRPTWLFLVRPDGWQDELDMLGEAMTEEAETATASTKLRTVERHLETTRASLEEARAELAAAAEREAALLAELSSVRSMVDPQTEELAVLRARVDELVAERTRVIKNLKTVEDLANSRLDAIRDLESELEDARSLVSTADVVPEIDDQSDSDLPDSPVVAPCDDPAHRIDVDQLALSLGQASGALQALVEAFDRASRAVSPPLARDSGEIFADSMTTPSGADPMSGGEENGAGRGGSNLRQGRRRRIRLTKGATEGSTEGTLQAFRTPDVIVLIDGYNVAMQAWPQLNKTEQRECLIRVTSNLAARIPADYHLVFDGVGDGARPSVTTPLAVRLHFSSLEVEADDVILEMLDTEPVRPAIVVSSDNRVRAGARARGAMSIGSSELIDFAKSRVS